MCVRGNPRQCDVLNLHSTCLQAGKRIILAMLDVLRRNASGWLAKILIGLLVLSFAVWGVADMVTGVGRYTAAKVGSTEISAPDFQRAYQNQLDAIAQRFGRRLTPNEARTLLQLDSQVIEQLVAATAIDNHAQELNLAITDNAVIAAVQADPMFSGADGNFDPARLEQVLRQAGYTQERFLAERRRDMVRDQLTDALLQNVQPPQMLINLMQTYSGEARTVRYFVLDPKTAPLKAPTDDDLKKTYEQNKSQFMTPEYRKFEVLMLTSADAQKQIPVTDAELEAAYERDKALFAVPEKRQILQIAFKDETEAEKARAEILGGKSFEEVAKSVGAKPEDIDLGTLTRSQMFDPKIAEAAFSLEKDTVSEVVKGNLTTVLLWVKEISPGNQPKLDEIRDQLKERITRLGAGDQIRKLHDSVDDNRLAGKSLKEIADTLKLTFQAVESADRSGNGKDGKPAFASPDLARVVQTAFSGEVGVDNEVIELSDNGYAWVNLISVTATQQKPFDDVRDEVKTVWENNQRQDALRAQAKELLDKLKSGETFEAVAQSVAAEVQTTPAFKRGDRLPQLSASAVTRVFSLPKGNPIDVPTADNESRMVLEVTDIAEPPKADAKTLEEVNQSVMNQLRNDILEQYVMRLRSSQGASINQAVVDRTIGIVPNNP
jgi:peptidyl-prolyl cis-trans isomerase D